MNNNKELLTEKEKFEVAISDDRLIEIAERAEQRINAVIKIKRIALKVTNHNDWIDQKGKPYLTVSGAEKVARLFGISWMIDEPTYEEDKDGHFRYTYTGLFSFENVSIQAIGTRNSKDAFFSRSHGNDVPPSEIDKPNVKKAAYTNLVGNGITRLLGIRNLTYEDLKTANITKDKITSIQYNKDKPQKSSEKPKKGSPVNDQTKKDTSPTEKTWPNRKAFAEDVKSYEHEDMLGLDQYADILTLHEVNPDELLRLNKEQGLALYHDLEKALESKNKKSF